MLLCLDIYPQICLHSFPPSFTSAYLVQQWLHSLILQFLQLNPLFWFLLSLCAGETVTEIESEERYLNKSMLC